MIRYEQLRQSAANLVPERRLVGSVATVSAGTLVSYLLIAGSMPVISRLFTPSEMGVYYSWVATISLLTMLATLRYEMAIPIPRRARDARRLLLISLASAGSVLAFLAGLWWLWGQRIQQVTGLGIQPGYVVLLFLAVAAEATSAASRSWNIRVQRLPTLAVAKVVQSASLIAGQIGGGLLNLGLLGLLLFDLISRAACSAVQLRSVQNTAGVPWTSGELTRLRLAAQRYRRFPLFSLPGAVLMQLIDGAPLFLFSAVYGTAVTGMFALGQRAILGPLLILSGPITQVYTAEASRLLRESPAELGPLYWRMAIRLASLAVVPVLLMAVFGPRLFTILFGAEWAQAGVFLRLMAPAVLATFVAGPLYQTLDLLQRQAWTLLANSLGLVLICSVFGVCHMWRLPPEAAVAAYSAAVGFFNLVLFCLSAGAVLRFQRCPVGAATAGVELSRTESRLARAA
ncbi:MAG: oligosaccharide flippase family protein [Pirellulaceae bacterium]|nr:oligosaccharide flippase family protein [Pirellulaceae bacterium]